MGLVNQEEILGQKEECREALIALKALIGAGKMERKPGSRREGTPGR